MRKPIAVLTGDWHIRSKPPVARSGEKNWLETQNGYLRQVEKIASIRRMELFDTDRLPILFSGDLFDKHNPNPELINFLMNRIPRGTYAIPGNHDLPNGRYDDLEKSGYWTLREAGRIINLNPQFPGPISEKINLRIWPMPWGVEPYPCPEPHDLYIEIALVHAYLWVKGCGYHGAPEESRIGNIANKFKGYDVVVSADNHIPWTVKKNGTLFVNVGSLMRLTADQENYRPAVWILYDDITVEPRYLDISKDVFSTSHLPTDNVGNRDVFGLIESIRNAHDETVDFDEAVRRVLRQGHLSKEVKGCLISLTTS